jgi:alkylhydroperoxidase/carboxymuconolactone decarboxylase family protein YurZ
MSFVSRAELSSFERLLEDSVIAQKLRQDFEPSLRVVSQVWRAAVETRSLTPRMTELILLGMHASASSLNESAVSRHIGRAKTAGATNADIVDVLMTIAGVATHALYASLPVLIEELRAAGMDPGDDDEAATAEYEAAKREFLAARGGFWNPGRDVVAQVVPRFAAALIAQSAESWKSGSLSIKEREFICIAIDCTVTHSYEPGLRLHIKRALEHGASSGELKEVLELAAVMGLEGLVIGAQAMTPDPCEVTK